MSTPHIEAVWNIIKAKIKNTYYVIPKINLFGFIRETEYKYTLKDKNYEQKILDFVESYNLLNNVQDVNFSYYDYMNYLFGL